RQSDVTERDLRAVVELGDEQEVPDQQRIAHGLGGYAERLDDERAQQQRDDDRPGDGLEVVAGERARRAGGRHAGLRPPQPRSTRSTARNASWGTSTVPICFIRRLPSFCFSRSLRLRVMSPP